MRIVDQVHREEPLWARDFPTAGTGRMSIHSSSECDASRSPIGTAMSWLLACVVEGFAACGEAMHPGCAGLGERVDRQVSERNSQSGGHEQIERGGGAP